MPRLLCRHALLYAYSPAKPTMGSNWDKAYGENPIISRYPGDSEVDIVCFDRYGNGDYSVDLVNDCERVVEYAEAHRKIPAICETGVKSGIQNEHHAWWYRDQLLTPILTKCPRVAFVYTWRNGSPRAYWVPLPGSAIRL